MRRLKKRGRLWWWVFPDDIRSTAEEWERAMIHFNGWVHFGTRRGAEKFCRMAETVWDVRVFYTNNRKRLKGHKRNGRMHVWYVT